MLRVTATSVDAPLPQERLSEAASWAPGAAVRGVQERLSEAASGAAPRRSLTPRCSLRAITGFIEAQAVCCLPLPMLPTSADAASLCTEAACRYSCLCLYT